MTKSLESAVSAGGAEVEQVCEFVEQAVRCFEEVHSDMGDPALSRLGNGWTFCFLRYGHSEIDDVKEFSSFLKDVLPAGTKFLGRECWASGDGGDCRFYHVALLFPYSFTSWKGVRNGLLLMSCDGGLDSLDIIMSSAKQEAEDGWDADEVLSHWCRLCEDESLTPEDSRVGELLDEGFFKSVSYGVRHFEDFVRMWQTLKAVDEAVLKRVFGASFAAVTPLSRFVPR